MTALQWRSRGHDLHVGVGVAHGYATIGAIGFEVASTTAHRDGPTLASRLCAEAAPGRIL